MSYRELFKVKGLPVFQNKMFADRAAALACPKRDMTLVQDMETGLIYNASFDASLLEYDADYQLDQQIDVFFGYEFTHAIVNTPTGESYPRVVA